MIVFVSISIVIVLFISLFGFIGITHYSETLGDTEESKRDSFWLRFILIVSLLAFLTCQGIIIHDNILNERQIDVLEEE